MTPPPDPTAPQAEPPPPAPDLAWSGMTHTGRFRSNNEDSFLALMFDEHDVRYLGKVGQASLAAADFVFAVSDGMGGAESGEFASRSALDRITRMLPPRFSLSATGIESAYHEALEELISAIHADLISLGRAYSECSGMGATLSLCWFRPRRMFFAHVGDSRVYHLPHRGGLCQLTHDHTHVGWLRRRGEINEREARSHPQRNRLQQALGAGNQFVEPHIGAVSHGPGDRFLICSDGLVDGLTDRRIEEMARMCGSDAQKLVAEAVENSGRDNTTAVLVDVAPPGA